MSKGLEALERMGKQVLYCEYAEGFKVKELADYEIVEKELKALEIIKEKKVDVLYIIENPEEKNVIWYNARFMGVLCEGWRMLSQEEYDSVREVLL